MRTKLMIALGAAALAATGAQAGSQSSNSSSNSSSNNGRTVQTLDESYCEDGYCERWIERRVTRDRERRWRDRERRRAWRERYDD